MTPTSHAFTTRPERPGDEAAIRAVNVAAFPGNEEADLVDALRRDPEAWIPGRSTVILGAADEIIGHALLTRCTVGGEPALALAPCAVAPAWQGKGAGSAVIRAALAAAAERAAAGGENLVVVLGHAAYYPRFGFTPAAGWDVTGPFEVPEDHFLALALCPERPTPRGEIAYPVAFGV